MTDHFEDNLAFARKHSPKWKQELQKRFSQDWQVVSVENNIQQKYLGFDYSIKRFDGLLYRFEGKLFKEWWHVNKGESNTVPLEEYQDFPDKFVGSGIEYMSVDILGYGWIKDEVMLLPLFLDCKRLKEWFSSNKTKYWQDVRDGNPPTANRLIPLRDLLPFLWDFNNLNSIPTYSMLP